MSDQNSSVSFKKRRGLRLMGLNLNADGIVKGFFGGNAYLAILFLLFICLFLWKSGIGFVPSYQRELTEARTAGIEVSNKINYELKGFDALSSRIASAYSAEKRERFGDLETLLYVSQEFEAVADDHCEDDVEEYLDMDEGPEKEAAALAIKKKILEQCKALPQETLVEAVAKRIPSTTEISGETITKAIEYTQLYALDDFETHEDINNIPNQISSQMGAFGATVDKINASSVELKALHTEVEKTASKSFEILKSNFINQASIESSKEAIIKHKKNLESEKREEKISHAKATIAKLEEKIAQAEAKIINLDADAEIQPIYEALKKHDQIVAKIEKDIPVLFAELQALDCKSPKAKEYISTVSDLLPDYLAILDEQKAAIVEWKHDEPVTLTNSIVAFFLGTDWTTGSNRQSVYGLIPLFSGSLLISVVAMFFAVPLAIGAAIYVNQFASKKEANLLKPAIEFIQAIPSVVLGLFGILVVGGLLKDLSASPLLEWIPGFPITDRLNVLLAGILLAFMASPTIFTLAEDALNNVPKAFTEASLAMGATKLQTAIKVIVPACLSGIIAAIMLGFGRVIGETMVVLLVAGNKAKIPDFDAGLGVLGQPVHTMTGIIAQEYGEAAQGSTLYQSLFMVGLVLFTISLVINTLCQRVLSRNKQ